LLAGQLFPWGELPRNCSRVDVLEWYIEIGKDQSQFGSLTAHTSVCNMWSKLTDWRLKLTRARRRNGWILYWQGVHPLSIVSWPSIWMVVTMWDLMSHGQERGQGKIHCGCYPNLFSLNLPSTTVARRFSFYNVCQASTRIWKM
jgi:hypothetical protein